LEGQIDNLAAQIKKQKDEIERLKLDRRVYQQEKTKKAATFTSDHLERVLKQEMKRQFQMIP
jgi:hypothetical protein